MENVGKYNFDHPDAMDWPLIKETFYKLCNHQDVEVPNYNYQTCKRDSPGISVKCTDLILFEGIFALFEEQMRDIMDLKIFVHSDDDIRLLRRLKRDVLHRGRTVDGVIKSYNRFVKASYDEYIKPTMKYADIIIPRGAENDIAIQFVTENLINKLKDRGVIAQVPGTVDDFTKSKLSFPILDETLHSFSKYTSQIRVYDKSIMGEKQAQDFATLLEKIMVRMIYNIDSDLQTIHFDFLTNQLLTLLKKHNQDEDITSSKWQFLNKSEQVWLQGTKGLKNALESLQMDTIENLCIFIPEFTSKDQTNIDHFREIINLLRHFDGHHTIGKIHILCYFMGSALPQALMDFPNFSSIFFYPLSLNNELSKYPCFIEDHHRHLVNDEDISLESKLEAFKQKGSLNTHECYKSFYSHHQNNQTL
eukprot:403330835